LILSEGMRQRGPRDREKKFYEDVAYVLDFLPYGYGVGYPRGGRYQSRPVAQAVGERYFMLLELAPLEGLQLRVGERISLSGGLEGEVIRVTRRLRYDELTASARAELPNALTEIVKRREKFFVEFFNTAQPLTTKMHSLELLRGIGKKTLWKILEERRKRPFESFEDIRDRIKIDPLRLIVDRIIEELRGEQRHYLFVAPYRRREWRGERSSPYS